MWWPSVTCSFAINRRCHFQRRKKNINEQTKNNHVQYTAAAATFLDKIIKFFSTHDNKSLDKNMTAPTTITEQKNATKIRYLRFDTLLVMFKLSSIIIFVQRNISEQWKVDNFLSACIRVRACVRVCVFELNSEKRNCSKNSFRLGNCMRTFFFLAFCANRDPHRVKCCWKNKAHINIIK